ncbi:MAG: response regulator [Sphingobacteriaceae bacterium]|nr:response regulator [Sphingobacteriaceae bacterium]
MKHGLIAIIDDDELDRHIYKKIILLTCPSYKIVDFSNGLEALNYMRKHANDPLLLPDLLLLDVRMPYLNGWQYLEQYCKLKPKLSKVTRHYVCSSSIERFDMEFKNCDLHGYYMKPVAPKDIKKIVFDTEQYNQAS